MMPEHIYLSRLAEILDTIGRAETVYQQRTRWHKYFFVLNNLMLAHPKSQTNAAKSE